MASVCGSGVHINANKFVLEAVVFNRLFLIWLSLCFGYLVNVVLRVSCDHIMITVRFQVENLREFKVLVNFVISERIKVEYNSLQVNYQHVRCLCNQGSFADVNCLLATIAFVIVYHLRSFFADCLGLSRCL